MVQCNHKVTIQGRKEEVGMKRQEKVLMTVAFIVLVLAMVGISYAFFNYFGQGSRENTITTGNLTFVYDESNKSGNGISIDNATPTSDAIGSVSKEQGKVFEFTVTASTKGAPIYYEIYVAKQNSSTLPEEVIKTYLTEVQGTEEIGVPNTLTNENINTYNKLGVSQVPEQENGRTLYQEMLPEGQANYTKTFRYRMWISDTATEVDENGIWKYNDMSFTVKVNVYASNEEIGVPLESSTTGEYIDESGANSPTLVQGQIPVIYNDEQKTWVKADTTKKWYDYSNQEWANAVTVKETGTKTREEYMGAEVGTPVSMDDINTMWVWIPRYEYMYTNLGTAYAGGTKEQPGEIKVNFLNGKSTTPSDSANYKIHPAFTFGSDELEGLWYAKFEVGGTLSKACIDESCNVSNVIIKPSVTSLRNQNVSSFFYMSRSMQMNNASAFGFSTTDSDLHMSKNSEWGSVAYLSQSKYGKYGNSNYEGVEKEVRINNCSNYITGVGANSRNEKSSTSTCTSNTYETEKGQTASTTGNMTGVYDMSGGSWEYVMGNLNKTIGNSNFTTLPDEKYYDVYTSSNPSSYNGNLSESACKDGICYGHALSETGLWYNDTYYYVTSSNPWLVRGGCYYDASDSGVFYSFYVGSSGFLDMRSAHFVLARVGV